MQVSLENTSHLGRKLTVTVPADRFKQELRSKSARLEKKVNVPGFRKGKAPKKLLEAQVRPQAYQEAVSALLESSLSEAIDEQKLNVATQPEITHLKAETDQEFSYQATFEEFPEVVLPVFSDIKVEKYSVSITEPDVENTLEKIRKQLASEENKLPELDDTFAKQIGASSSDTATIQQRVREILEGWLNKAIQTRLREEVVQALLKAVPLEVPKGLLDNEMAALHQQYHQQQGGEPGETCQHEGLETEATQRIVLGLIVKQILAQEKLVLDQNRLKQQLSELAKIYPVEYLQHVVHEIQSRVLTEQALECVLNQATVSEKIGTVDELLK